VSLNLHNVHIKALTVIDDSGVLSVEVLCRLCLELTYESEAVILEIVCGWCMMRPLHKPQPQTCHSCKQSGLDVHQATHPLALAASSVAKTALHMCPAPQAVLLGAPTCLGCCSLPCSWSASSKLRTGSSTSWPARSVSQRLGCASQAKIGPLSASGSPDSGRSSTTGLGGAYRLVVGCGHGVFSHQKTCGHNAADSLQPCIKASGCCTSHIQLMGTAAAAEIWLPFLKLVLELRQLPQQG